MIMLNLKRYVKEFGRLSFLDKHEALNTWVSGVLALAGLLLSMVVFKVTEQLQHQANALQKQIFVRGENEQNAQRVREAVLFFRIEDTRPSAMTTNK